MTTAVRASEVAVITRGASGFGRALGACCAERGMHVVLLDIDGERAAQEAAALAAAHGVDGLGMAVDVSQADAVAAAAAAVSQRFDRADLVVSNVGVQLFGAVERLTDEEWRWVLDVNVVGAARTTPGIARRSARHTTIAACTRGSGAFASTVARPIGSASSFRSRRTGQVRGFSAINSTGTGARAQRRARRRAGRHA